MIQETGPNHPTSLYIYTDQNSYEPLARIDTDGNHEQHIRYFHTDLNGCPEELTDANGKILWECSFQLWGKRIHEIEHEPIEQNLRYQGQYLDRETGLHYNTFRYYDPDIGRFTQPDPIGLLGGFNLYQYAPNGLTWIDPLGWHKNSNDTNGDWVLYDVIDKESGRRAKTGIGKAEDVMADGQNRRAYTSARKVRKDPNFGNAESKVVRIYRGITKGKMKRIEAGRVRLLRRLGHELPHNRERDKRYRPSTKKNKWC
ncbi:hypothetical protein BHC44_02490 [Snodgrassella alvi]|nr:hypothetical protein BHC44_02490 [Snodgrassella alvi]